MSFGGAAGEFFKLWMEPGFTPFPVFVLSNATRLPAVASYLYRTDMRVVSVF